jgi:hypothetical protein
MTIGNLIYFSSNFPELKPMRSQLQQLVPVGDRCLRFVRNASCASSGARRGAGVG